MVRIGGYARTLGVGEICFKNTLFQSFRPPCSFIVSDMEPSMSLYRKMNRKEYVQALHERLEPASACDLIYTQFKERTQKAGEVYDLYLRDKYNLFIREKNPKLSRKSLRLIRTNVRVYCHIIRPIQCLTNPLYTN